jgi:Ankyrin repeats (3 copies)
MNFLGQTPLHIAVCRPSRLKALLDAGHDINARDKNGITALMYAAAMNPPLAVAILIRRGADLFLRDYLGKYDFITYAAVRNNWSLVWSAVEVIESRDRDLLLRTFSRIISAPRPPLLLKEGLIWIKVFMVSVVSKMDMNVCFEDGRTLIHVVGVPPFARLLIKHGFTALNQQDHAGEHCLFAIAKFLDPQLFRLFLEKGADINLKNHKGHSVLRQVVDRLSIPRKAEVQRLLDFLSMLLSNGADVTAADNCACGCTSGGCLPISGLQLEVQALLETRVNNPFWIFEWLCMLKDHGKLAEAKSNALSVLRRAKFDEASLVHTCLTCCSYGVDIGSHLNEDRFWDISRVVELDKLNDEMGAWEARTYDEITTELMVHLKNLSMKKQEQISGEMDRAATSFQKENTTGQTIIVSIHAPAPHFMVMIAD